MPLVSPLMASPEAYGSGFGTTIATTTNVAVGAGRKAFAVINWWGGAGGSLSGVADPTLGAWHIDDQNTGSAMRVAIATIDCPAGLASGTVVTATLSVSSEARDIRIFSCDGLQLNSAGGLDATAKSTDATTTNWSQAITTVNATDAVFGYEAVNFYTGGIAPVAPSIELLEWANTDGASYEIVYREVTAAGATSVGGTHLNKENAHIAVAYKLALTAYAAAVLADAPLMWWRGGEPSGTAMLDSSGNGRHGVINGAAWTLGVAGALGAGGDSELAIRKTSTANTSFVSIASAAWMNGLTALSFAEWFKTSSSNGVSLTRSGGSTVLQTALGVDATGHANFKLKTSAGTVTITDTAVTNDGAYHHRVGTWDGTTMRLYVDKVLVASGALGGTLDTAANGIQWGGGSALTFMPGDYQDAQYFGSALSAARVEAHYNAGLGIVALAQFEGWGVPI